MLEENSVKQPLSEVVSSLQKNEHAYRKRLNQDIESKRFECFCSRQYLSYTALYCHVKNKHPDYFVYNRGLTNGNLVDTYDPTYGFKIRKLTQQKVRIPTEERRINHKPMQMLKTPTQSATQNLNAGYLLGKQQIWRIYQLNEIKKLQDKIFQSRQCKDLQDKWLKIYNQKLQKMESIISNMSQIADYYQRVLRIINIKSVVHALDNPTKPGQEEEDSEQND